MQPQQLAQQTNKSFFSILWSNLQGEFSRSLKAGDFTGVASVAVSKLTGSLVVIALGPVLGPFVSSISSYVIEKSLPVLGRTYADWNNMRYAVSVSKSGIVKLENPQTIAAQRVVASIPKRLEIPADKFIKPTQELSFNPTFAYKPIRQQTLGGTQPWRIPPAGKGSTPMNALLAQGVGRTGLSSNVPFTLSTFNKINPSYRPLTDIVYPNWVFDQQGLQRLNRPTFTGTPVFQQNFGKWYMNDPLRARQFQDVARNISLSSSKTYNYEPDFWGKVIDFIDDLFS